MGSPIRERKCKKTCMLILITLLGSKLIVAAFDFTCPSASHKHLREGLICNAKSKKYYSCLFDENKNSYAESCSNKTDYVRPGQKYVIRGLLVNTNCSYKRYQPFKFWSNGSSNCVFKKSVCSEVGQVVNKQTLPTIDNNCRCDYTNGYSFLNVPMNRCYCIPTLEDCTCYKVSCPKNTILSSDYKCKREVAGSSPLLCPPVTQIGQPNDRMDVFRVPDTGFVSAGYRRYAVICLTAVLGLMVLLALFYGCYHHVFASITKPKAEKTAKNRGNTDAVSEDGSHKPSLPGSKQHIPSVETQIKPENSSTKKNQSKVDAVTVDNSNIRPPPADIQHIPVVKTSTESESQSTEKDKSNADAVTVEGIHKPTPPKRPPLPFRPPQPIQDDEKSIDQSNGKELVTFYGNRDENEIRIVLVGRTGSGKSATGNTIMAKANQFESKLTGDSVTRECKRGECSQNGRKLVVIDTPGLFDTKVTFEKISKEIIRCINLSTPGPHAFLLVVQINRFTNEEIETFDRLFELFGEGMGRFAIITFTKLDDLERDGATIETFIQSAPLKLRSFLNKCNGNYIAFNNNASEKKKLKKVQQLIRLIDEIKLRNCGKHYTNQMYEEAEAALQRKVKVVEKQKALQKKREIEKIESKYVDQINNMKKKNKELSDKVSNQFNIQKEAKKEKEKTINEIQRVKEELKNIDKKRNADTYELKIKLKEEKNKRARELERKERQQTLELQKMQKQQQEANRRCLDIEREKNAQLAKVTEEYKKVMQNEIHKIVQDTNEKHNEMMRELQQKDMKNRSLEAQLAQQTSELQDVLRQREKDISKQQETYEKRILEEREKRNEAISLHIAKLNKKIEETQKHMLEQHERQRQEKEAEIRHLEEMKRVEEKRRSDDFKRLTEENKRHMFREKELARQHEIHIKTLEMEKEKSDKQNMDLRRLEEQRHADQIQFMEERHRYLRHIEILKERESKKACSPS